MYFSVQRFFLLCDLLQYIDYTVCVCVCRADRHETTRRNKCFDQKSDWNVGERSPCYLCVSLQCVSEGVCVVVLQQPLLQVVVTELGPAGSSLLCRVSRAPQARRVHHHHGGQRQLLAAQRPAHKHTQHTHQCNKQNGLTRLSVPLLIKCWQLKKKRFSCLLVEARLVWTKSDLRPYLLISETMAVKSSS